MNFRINDYGKYEQFIADNERRFALPRNLLAMTLYQASAFDADKIACKDQHPTIGVRGIASLTLSDCKIVWNGDDRRSDPYASIIACARLLKRQYAAFNNWRLALLAYHSSAQSVIDAIQCRADVPIDANRYVQQAAAEVRELA